MKKLCLLFSLCPVFLWGQVKIDFENGLPAGMEQFPSDRWGAGPDDPSGDNTSLYHIYDNSSSARDAFSVEIPEPDMDFEFNCSFVIDYQYNPSGSNNWSFYVLSEYGAEHMANRKNNYAIMLGVNQTSTDDTLMIYYQDGDNLKEILKTRLHYENDIGMNCWKFSVSISPAEGLMVAGGPFPGETAILAGMQDFSFPGFHPAYIGLSYSYTSSKDMLLRTDDISVSFTPLKDSIPPRLERVKVISHDLAEFQFDEKLYKNGPEISSTLVCSFPVDSVWITENSLFVRFDPPPARDTEISYEISGLSDRAGNPVLSVGYFIFYYPDWHDVIFSEIMADPAPPVYLPEMEYIEIFNRSDQEINLEGWKLYTGSREWILPPVVLLPGDYHFFTSSDEYSVYSEKHKFSPVFTSSSVINNTEQDLLIYTANDEIIDAVKYSGSWYDDDFKAEGGWSLERTDLENLCGEDRTWKASEAFHGGTPGEKNTVSRTEINSEAPYIRQVIYENDSIFRLRFNESLDKNVFHVNMNGMLSENPSIKAIELQEPFFSECRIKLYKTGMNIPLVFTNAWTDCCGNTSYGRDSVILKEPADPVAGSVIISEVLFSPWPGCPEFIELYNNTNEVLSLYDLKLSIGDGEKRSSKEYFIADEEILFFPGTFLVLGQNPPALKSFYDLPGFFNYKEVRDMASLPDKGGKISVYDRGNMLIDEMNYSATVHFPLLSDYHGVSMERVILDTSPGIASEWHSASSLSGFATPGRLNSQNILPGEKESDFYCEYKVFSPNNDGYRDMALLNIRMEKEGYVAMIRVFDASGRLKKTLGNNELLGTEERVTWDGLDDMGRLCSSGIYMIYMEAFHLSGSKKVFREGIVLSR